MAKQDWSKLQAEFLIAHEKTNVSVKDWCEAQGLKYTSARRYIKSTRTKAKIKQQNKVKTEVKTKAKPVIPAPKTIGNLKHGGYSKYFNRDITELVRGTDLTDELELCRSRIHLVVCTIEEIQRRLEQKEPRVEPEVAASLYESLFKADTALDRNIARVESITKTLSSIKIDSLQERKIIADTRRSIEITKATVINAKKSIIQTELTTLQVEQLRKEVGGTSKLDDYIDSRVSGQDSVVG